MTSEMAVKSMRYLILLMAILSFSGCTAMLLGNNSSVEVAPNTTRTPTEVNSDSVISGQIRQQYNDDAEISNFTLGIRTASGRVTLTGTVGSYGIRDRVIDIAQNTHGVVSVDSRVVVNTNL